MSIVCLSGCVSTADVAGIIAGERKVTRPTASPPTNTDGQKQVEAPPTITSQDAIPVVVVEPSEYLLTYNIFSIPGQNPDINGRPSPLQIRIYQLDHDAIYKSADFLTLYKNDKQVLGTSMLGWEPVMVFPGDKITGKTIKMSRKTDFVGVLGSFQEYEGLFTHDYVDNNPLQDQFICIYIKENGLEVKRAISSAACESNLKR